MALSDTITLSVSNEETTQSVDAIKKAERTFESDTEYQPLIERHRFITTSSLGVRSFDPPARSPSPVRALPVYQPVLIRGADKGKTDVSEPDVWEPIYSLVV
ncbi:hypothetical protein AQUCO_00100853v1 [Aquilegia coerulea]|uniref:Uncharacterized protein n=1 Tax=Aquilegia coerulea TaxID=218851 RepID=A0A2G5FC90_AQUCA|nr:hypothetical protein AQUCO_00100853v1 [Aquilegia coerulea]